MKNEQATYRRVLRRETHASRTAPATVTALIVFVLLLAAIAAGVWWLVDDGFRERVTREFDAFIAVMLPVVPIAAGAVLVILALVLLALALLPGRRARRARMTQRTALLVDDGVIADSVAEAVARRAGVERSRASVTVGRRNVTVRITPTSGIPVDRFAAESAVTDILAEIGFSANPRIIVEASGVVA